MYSTKSDIIIFYGVPVIFDKIHKIEVLVEIFNKSEDEAVTLMQTVHNNGSAVVGVYTYDIAVTKAGIATERAREKGFPLKIEVKLK